MTGNATEGFSPLQESELREIPHQDGAGISLSLNNVETYV